MRGVLRRLTWPLCRSLRSLSRSSYRAEGPGEPELITLLAAHWIGDTFWASQIVPFLKERYPRSELRVFTKPAARELWCGLIPAESVILAPWLTSDRRREKGSWLELWRQARRHRQEPRRELLIDLMGNRYSAFFSWSIRPSWALGFDGDWLGGLYSNQSQAANAPQIHLSERPFALLRELWPNLKSPDLLRPVAVELDGRALLDRLGLKDGRPLALLLPGAGWPEKEWGDQRFAMLARALVERGWRVALLGSPGEKGRLAAIARELAGALVLCGALSESMALLPFAGAVVCNDSGFGHLAGAAGAATWVIFRKETRPERCGARGPRVRILEALEGQEDELMPQLLSEIDAEAERASAL